MCAEFKPIGVIRTPYKHDAPYQPVEGEGDFRIVLDKEYSEGLYKLETFRYIYVFYHTHLARGEPSMTVSPSWAGGYRVGVFASRSPVRPNNIALSVVRIRKIEGNEIHTTGLDALDGTPLLDIKPYIRDLDSKADADYGWVDELEDRDHLMLHIRGEPHDY